ncbi:hypothetical protein CEXT_403181 [Caerostris extrusa]|uniref:Uncharacterized protein n=1 Tax=Caerostris extrusa TaxID=172846 RepID=A0AAV4X6T7_CAEEX|nr:hypothetical protein CEXT_403181 [Caerostris extrusa]
MSLLLRLEAKDIFQNCAGEFRRHLSPDSRKGCEKQLDMLKEVVNQRYLPNGAEEFRVIFGPGLEERVRKATGNA